MDGASTRTAQDYRGRSDDFLGVNARILEAGLLVLMILAVGIGGTAWLADIAKFHGIAIAVLGTLAIVVIYGFRRSYLAGGPLARLHATRDAAFLAAIAAAIAFVALPARWALGATVVGVEFALVVELFARFTPAAP
jgi:hypothetical protein